MLRAFQRFSYLLSSGGLFFIFFLFPVDFMNASTTKRLWRDLPRPFQVLAPMEDVTDTVFRRVVAASGRPDVFFSEFTGVDGLCGPQSQRIGRRLQYTPAETPIVVQIWGNNPENYATIVPRLTQMGFSGVDINMGCPIRKLTRKGFCSALIENRSLASEIIHATRENAGPLPVSVKTRIGFRTRTTEAWIGFLLEHGLDALTVHGRIASQMSEGDADWKAVAECVRLRDQLAPETVVIGNGDVRSQAEVARRVEESGVDGVMIGRGIFENLYIFRRDGSSFESVPVIDRVMALRRHFRLHRRQWGDRRNYHALKKFVKMYMGAGDHVADFTDAVLHSRDYAHGAQLIEDYLASLRNGKEVAGNETDG
ncbi:MAG: tRNA-dihydrouridine synthase family protein [Spirochaetaceae bacterium]|nr:MAG: tRNA-dihydrouridine synthase family protein [Spirochaetaceae bacterium]